MDTPTIAIIGAGFGGLAAAIKLKEAGFEAISIFEQAERLGGTWHYNSYPGAACDVPVHLYSFSYDPNPDWSHLYARQTEIQAYLERAADKYGLRPHIHLGAEAKAAHWSKSSAKWRLTFENGAPIEADILIAAVGQLNRPRFPDIEGREKFAGASFHSARWDHGCALSGKKICVIGNAASAVQFIPEIAKDAAKLTIFQRTANYILPRNDSAIGEFGKSVHRLLPWTMKWRRNFIYWRAEWLLWGAFDPQDWRARAFTGAARHHLAKHVEDPTLRAKLWPDYPIGCKRILFSDDYYPTLCQPNVSLVTDPIERIDETGVRTKDGALHECDVLIFGTGFETSAFDWGFAVNGEDGVSLKTAWTDGAEAYLGVAAKGFPNLFMMYGPNTNLGHNSILMMIEAQAGYIAQCVEAMSAQNLGIMEARTQAQAEFNQRLQEALSRTAWAGACASWYKTASGKITNNWMGDVESYRRELQTPNLNDFVLHPRIDYSLLKEGVSREHEAAEAPP
ncbi:MAG: flavin-containing monooxygenase [Hyphomonadaceae bacterium]